MTAWLAIQLIFPANFIRQHMFSLGLNLALAELDGIFSIHFGEGGRE